MSKDITILVVVIIVLASVAAGLVYWQNQRTLLNNLVVNSNIATVNKTTVANTTNTNVTAADGSSEPEYSFVTPITTKTVTGEITTYTFSIGNILNVMPVSNRNLVLAETPIKSQHDITIGNTAAQYLTISSAKDGSDVHVVQVTVGDTLYDFRGSDGFLDSLNNYIQFNTK